MLLRVWGVNLLLRLIIFTLLYNKSVITCFLFWLRARTTAFQMTAAKLVYQTAKCGQ